MIELADMLKATVLGIYMFGLKLAHSQRPTASNQGH